MITETEAKTKWCPLARVVPGTLTGETMISPLPAPSAHNRIDETGERTEATWNNSMNCIASTCMAWRWQVGRPDNAVSGETFKGFCGAFGRDLEWDKVT